MIQTGRSPIVLAICIPSMKEDLIVTMSEPESVVIIGGGPAGLTAAWELVKDGSNAYDVTLLEESEEFGGIARTVKHDGNRMDIGGHRFFSKDERIMDWWQETLPLQGAPSYDDKKLGRDTHDLGLADRTLRLKTK